MVKDGYLRLFGDAVERKLVTVVIEGAGIERIPQDQADESGTLYKVTQPVPHLSQEAHTASAENTPPGSYVTWEAFQDFEAGIKDILRSFLEFFTIYMVESNGQPKNHDVEALGAKLQGK